MVAAAAISTVYWNPAFPGWVRVSVIAVAVGAVARPREALLVVATTCPFANLLLSAAGSRPFRAPEALVLAFLVGWLLRRPPDSPSPLRRRLLLPIGVLGAIVISSSAALARELYRTHPTEFYATMASLRMYLWIEDITGIVAGALIIEGLLLVVAIVELTYQRSRLALALIDAMGLAAFAAAGLTVLLAVGVLPSALMARGGLPEQRFVAHTSDLNAAGSYFAMMLALAGGMTATTRGSRRWLWAAGVAVIAAALVLSGSRTALGAAVMMFVAAGIWLIASSGRGARISARAVWGAALAAVLLAGLVFVRMPLSHGAQIRRDFTVTSVRMMEARPILGVGIGRYYPLSRLILTPRLGVLYAEENAHNYFLQVGAELGLAGLIAFVWFHVTALKPAVRLLGEKSRDAMCAGLLAGAAVFLVTSLTGHPFLVREASFPFWMILALCVVVSRLSERNVAHGRWTSRIAVTAALVLIASIPFRPGVPRLRLKPAQDGFGPWRIDEHGRRYRDMSAFGAVYVGPRVTGLEIPVRLADTLRNGPPMRVIDQEPGWSQHQAVVGKDWVVIRMTLPTAAPLMPYQRVNLNVLNLNGAEPSDPKAPAIAVRDILITSAAP